MGTYQEIEGDLIELTRQRNFEVIVHGVNCFNSQTGGLAPQMVKAFQTDKFKLENVKYQGDKRKLGHIDWVREYIDGHSLFKVFVVNAYTQYHPGPDFRLESFKSCLEHLSKLITTSPYLSGRKIPIGFPQIGCGIGGGNWEEVKYELQSFASKHNVTLTVVIYKPQEKIVNNININQNKMTIKEQIYQYLQQNPEGVKSPGVLSKKIQKPLTTVKNSLRNLVKEGVVVTEKDDRGFYTSIKLSGESNQSPSLESVIQETKVQKVVEEVNSSTQGGSIEVLEDLKKETEESEVLQSPRPEFVTGLGGSFDFSEETVVEEDIPQHPELVEVKEKEPSQPKVQKLEVTPGFWTRLKKFLFG